jgi:hypothetical protein
MLFEIFFNKDGMPRRRPKDDCLDHIFALQVYDALEESFGFIANALVATGGDYYAVPGTGHEVAVTVSTKSQADGVYVDAIYIDGKDVLRIDEDLADGDVRYARIDSDDLRESLRRQLFLPDLAIPSFFEIKESGEA